MKIKNLYIGDVRMITDIRYMDSGRMICDILYTTRFERTSIFEKKENNVKDIIFGGKYEIKGSVDVDGKVGDEYVSDLKQHALLKIIDVNNRKTISKRKMLKLIKQRTKGHN